MKLRADAPIIEFSPTEEILNEKNLGQAIIYCLKTNDPEGVMEVISTYLRVLNKVQMSQNADIPRSTIYHSLKAKNPTIRTLAKLVHASTPAETAKSKIRK